MTVRFDTYCGLSCATCEYKLYDSCKGCIESGGNEKCEIVKCAKSRGKRFCGECENIPCDILKNYSYDEQQGDNGARIENCQRIKHQLVSEARVGINPVSYCGHHCDYCFLGEWCGGCRSEYNCCSYATIFEDKKCPNIECARGRNLSGCYQCEDLRDCKKGYYENENNNEYIAKATALFIKKYGETVYTTTLKRAIDNGINYPKTFDATGSVENALALLEKYLH